MTKLILIGGFLGSGKTPLLVEAAKKLTAEGKSVGLITNDQSPELVAARHGSFSRIIVDFPFSIS